MITFPSILHSRDTYIERIKPLTNVILSLSKDLIPSNYS